MFSCNGLFHEEPAFVLKDDLEGSAQATSVLSLVGQGVSRPSEMAARLQVPQTALSRPLARLTGLGLVAREVPFGVDAKGGKRSLYRLCDPFLRFWYTFALPHYSDPHFGEEKSDIKSLRHIHFACSLGRRGRRLFAIRCSTRRFRTNISGGAMRRDGGESDLTASRWRLMWLLSLPMVPHCLLGRRNSPCRSPRQNVKCPNWQGRQRCFHLPRDTSA